MQSALLAADGRASALAAELYRATGDLVGVEEEQWMNGGWRGRVHLVPALPMDKNRKHLEWILASAKDYDEFFSALTQGRDTPIPYRHQPIAFRFMQSVDARTPSAWALDWTIAYNVAGSLNISSDSVRETLFHEIFHLNDDAHGGWSPKALGSIYDSIVARCGARADCLAPYTPNGTMVRGGTYYAFQPNNGSGVHEYAAELALRYYREQRTVLAGKPPVRPAFKCGRAENRQAWALLINDFFGGIDRVPACR